MSVLFESGEINGMKLRNRFVRSATWEGMASPEGAVTPQLIETMTGLAKGGVGLIITSHAYVRPEGQASPWQIGVYEDRLIDGLRQMTAAVHAAGGRIALQLAHAGTFAAENLTGTPPLAVSAYDGLAKTPRRELTVGDITELVGAFAAAAGRAQAAGFDGVEIHSAHGYLLSQFLSPAFNRRTDDYGGDIRNRCRIHLEILQAVKKVTGVDYPVLVKLNCRDFTDDGLTLKDSIAAAGLLADAGLDAIELSGGLLSSRRLSPVRPQIDSEDKEAYFREELRAFRKQLRIPLILIGGIRSFGVVEGLVAEGSADYISMSRPLICEPGLVARWQAGDRRPAGCKSDNLCFSPGFEGSGIRCVTMQREEMA
ncbi:MAG: NADH:flavin oxidoreductase [Syntrophales bacterium]